MTQTPNKVTVTQTDWRNRLWVDDKVTVRALDDLASQCPAGGRLRPRPVRLNPPFAGGRG